MKRVYIFKYGVQQGSTATKESAVNLIRRYQKLETHRMLRAEFSIIVGEEEIIPYPTQKKTSERKSRMER